MALTKTQINYLENKIERVVHEKKQEFCKKFSNVTLENEILNKVKEGKIKFVPKAKMIELFDERINKTCYYNSLKITDFVERTDVDVIQQQINSNQAQINEYGTKLEKIKTKILDKIVLEGVDLDTALAEFDNI